MKANRVIIAESRTTPENNKELLEQISQILPKENLTIVSGRPYNNIKGEKFGNLTVIDKSDKRAKTGDILWILRCSCGCECYSTSANLKRGRVNICKDCNSFKSKQSPLKDLYNNYKRGALKRGYDYELTLEEFSKLIDKDCYYCGEPPSQTYKKSLSRHGIIYNGIDRYDNTKGYVIENCVPCCRFCNSAKSVKTAEEYKSWLNRLIQRNTI